MTRRGEHHRPGHVAAGAVDDVGAATAQDRPADGGRRRGTAERAEQRGPRLAREAADPEGVELEAGFRDEMRFDAIRRPGEAHERPPLAECLRHRERGQDVPCCPAGRDHEPKLPVRCHAERC